MSKLYENEYYYVETYIHAQSVKFVIRNTDAGAPVSPQQYDHTGYKEPSGHWPWRQKSINEAALLTIKYADIAEKKHKETLRQMDELRAEVDSISEILEIVAKI